VGKPEFSALTIVDMAKFSVGIGVKDDDAALTGFGAQEFPRKRKRTTGINGSKRFIQPP
jgi:hypothetical protein